MEKLKTDNFNYRDGRNRLTKINKTLNVNSLLPFSFIFFLSLLYMPNIPSPRIYLSQQSCTRAILFLLLLWNIFVPARLFIRRKSFKFKSFQTADKRFPRETSIQTIIKRREREKRRIRFSRYRNLFTVQLRSNLHLASNLGEKKERKKNDPS